MSRDNRQAKEVNAMKPMLQLLADSYVVVTGLAIFLLAFRCYQLMAGRRELKQRLAESEQRFRSLFEYNPDAIFLLDLDGHIISANAACEKVFGCRIPGILHKSFLQFIAPKDREKARNNFLKTRQGEPQTDEITCLHSDGHWIEMNVTSVPLIVNEEIVGVYGISKDITNRKRAEELLRKSDKLAVVGQLAAGVAHEIRNPLTALKGFVQLLKPEMPEKEQYFKIMLSELDRIEAIINEFLVLAKPQAVKYEERDVRLLLEDIIALFQMEAVMNNVEIFMESAPDVPLIHCEENQLKQVFINILKNAIEAMPNGGTVAIRVESHPPDKVLIRFADQGVGIPEERIPKLGEPFYTTKERGTGLGLMISYKIVEDHGGRIFIRSKVGEGTVVDVLLPVEAAGKDE
jgi:two-component system, sporulation sensor kinase E